MIRQSRRATTGDGGAPPAAPSPLRMAVIGAGWAGRRQTEAAAELTALAVEPVADAGRPITVVALVDTDREHLAGTAAELGVPHATTSLAEVLANEQIDAVSICTPHPLHVKQCIAAAEAGKHILVEKPMALRVADATRMLEAAHAAGVRLAVAESSAYSERAATLRALVDAGDALGELVAAAFAGGFRAPEFGYAGRRDWLTRPAAGGTGTWALHGIHTVAELRAIFGEVRSVYLRESKLTSFRRRDLEGTMSGVLGLERGVSLTVLQTTEARVDGGAGGTITLYGSDATVTAGDESYTVSRSGAGTGERAQQHRFAPERPSRYARELAAFAAWVGGGHSCPTSGASERRSLAVVEAGYESARTGQPIDIEERFGRI